MNCIFCKIINKEIPSKIIYEDDKVIATLDINPQSKGHTLLIPKEHFEDYTKLTSETLNHLFQVAQNLGNKIMTKLDQDGYSLLINYGTAQEIKHLHLHIIPNNKEKNVDINTILNAYKVEDLHNLTQGQWVNAMRRLDATK